MENLFGLPAHPLLVHVPVVLVPLAALGMLAIAFRPNWQRTFGPIVAALAGIGFIGTLLAAASGEELEDKRRAAREVISSTLEEHGEMGDAAQFWTGLFFVLVLAWVLFAWWRRRAGEETATAKVRKPKVVAVVLLVLASVSGVAAGVSIAVTGHNGAKAVWEGDQP